MGSKTGKFNDSFEFRTIPSLKEIQFFKVIVINET